MIMNARKLRIYSHHDADGIASAAIAVFVARRLGLNYDVTIRNQLTPQDVVGGSDIYWFNDMGSSRLMEMRNVRGVVTDHHNPVVLETHYSENGNDIYQFNPHLEGLDGSISQSGSTTTFLFGTNVLSEVSAVSHLPVVGSVGDLHDKKYGRLVDMDREIMLLAKSMGIIEVKDDIRYFGRSSKSVSYMLRFGNEPKTRALYDNPGAVADFLVSHGIDRASLKTIRWIDLEEEKRDEIISDLKGILEREGQDPSRLTGEVYELKTEPKSSIVKDARDFSSLINATSRKGKPEVGIRLCLFEKGDAMKEAMKLYSDHLDSLRRASKILDEAEGRSVGSVLYYDFGDSLENNITGTIATRIITHKKVPPSSVIVVMANLGSMKKISARISLELSEKVDLSLLFREAACGLGGTGGGHRNAAGAIVPIGKEREFVDRVNELMQEVNAT
ncbi:MAG: DHH family phosphoesterase [Candidatus Thermoplasmatota archaeon]|jgi:RecJ-like exonuclease|nr:DHH family phosphoesterase [Candidatus Thermoplasmatota archaeon]